MKRNHIPHSSPAAWRLLVACLTALLSLSASAQDKKDMFNPVNASVTSQTIAPDARAAGMGDVGAATDPDVNSQYWNPPIWPATIALATTVPCRARCAISHSVRYTPRMPPTP